MEVLVRSLTIAFTLINLIGCSDISVIKVGEESALLSTDMPVDIRIIKADMQEPTHGQQIYSISLYKITEDRSEIVSTVTRTNRPFINFQLLYDFNADGFTEYIILNYDDHGSTHGGYLSTIHSIRDGKDGYEIRQIRTQYPVDIITILGNSVSGTFDYIAGRDNQNHNIARFTSRSQYTSTEHDDLVRSIPFDATKVERMYYDGNSIFALVFASNQVYLKKYSVDLQNSQTLRVLTNTVSDVLDFWFMPDQDGDGNIEIFKRGYNTNNILMYSAGNNRPISIRSSSAEFNSNVYTQSGVLFSGSSRSYLWNQNQLSSEFDNFEIRYKNRQNLSFQKVNHFENSQNQIKKTADQYHVLRRSLITNTNFDINEDGITDHVYLSCLRGANPLQNYLTVGAISYSAQREIIVREAPRTTVENGLCTYY